jgi:hypothetical protein
MLQGRQDSKQGATARTKSPPSTACAISGHYEPLIAADSRVPLNSDQEIHADILATVPIWQFDTHSSLCHEFMVCAGEWSIESQIT